MTGLSDLVVLLIGKLYGKIQEYAPLPTLISALVRYVSSLIRSADDAHLLAGLYLFHTARTQILPEV